MIRIAFCDDDCSMLNSLHELLVLYRAEKNERIDDYTFHSSLDLIAEIERGTQFDILFLDILMPGENGIDAAAEIRNYDKNAKIIFLTSSTEFAVQSYTVNAFYAITMSCQAEIPIPRGKYNEIKNAFLEYAFLDK